MHYLRIAAILLFVIVHAGAFRLGATKQRNKLNGNKARNGNNGDGTYMGAVEAWRAYSTKISHDVKLEVKKELDVICANNDNICDQVELKQTDMDDPNQDSGPSLALVLTTRSEANGGLFSKFHKVLQEYFPNFSSSLLYMTKSPPQFLSERQGTADRYVRLEYGTFDRPYVGGARLGDGTLGGILTKTSATHGCQNVYLITNSHVCEKDMKPKAVGDPVYNPLGNKAGICWFPSDGDESTFGQAHDNKASCKHPNTWEDNIVAGHVVKQVARVRIRLDEKSYVAPGTRVCQTPPDGTDAKFAVVSTACDPPRDDGDCANSNRGGGIYLDVDMETSLYNGFKSRPNCIKMANPDGSCPPYDEEEDCAYDMPIGHQKEWAFYKVTVLADVCVALLSEHRHAKCAIRDYGKVNGIKPPAHDMVVVKNGYRTHRTEGRVELMLDFEGHFKIMGTGGFLPGANEKPSEYMNLYLKEEKGEFQRSPSRLYEDTVDPHEPNIPVNERYLFSDALLAAIKYAQLTPTEENIKLFFSLHDKNRMNMFAFSGDSGSFIVDPDDMKVVGMLRGGGGTLAWLIGKNNTACDEAGGVYHATKKMCAQRYQGFGKCLTFFSS